MGLEEALLARLRLQDTSRESILASFVAALLGSDEEHSVVARFQPLSEQTQLQAEAEYVVAKRGCVGLVAPNALDAVGHNQCIMNGKWHCARCVSRNVCQKLELGDGQVRWHPLSTCSGCGRKLHQEQELRQDIYHTN